MNTVHILTDGEEIVVKIDNKELVRYPLNDINVDEYFLSFLSDLLSGLGYKVVTGR